MSEKPPNKQDNPRADQSVHAIPQRIVEVDEIFKRFDERETEVDRGLEEQREDTRNRVTKTVLNSFVFLICLFSVTICVLSVLGYQGRAHILLESSLKLMGVITPIFTFILGFYYASKHSK